MLLHLPVVATPCLLPVAISTMPPVPHLILAFISPSSRPSSLPLSRSSCSRHLAPPPSGPSCGLFYFLSISSCLIVKPDPVCVSGEGELLGWQLLGAVVIIALGTIPTAAACIVLKKLALLRVTVEQEVLGLDVVYGLAAYVAKSQALRRCSGAAHLLREQGFEPKDLLESLMWLKGVIYRPFTPQAPTSNPSECSLISSRTCYVLPHDFPSSILFPPCSLLFLLRGFCYCASRALQADVCLV